MYVHISPILLNGHCRHTGRSVVTIAMEVAQVLLQLWRSFRCCCSCGGLLVIAVLEVFWCCCSCGGHSVFVAVAQVNEGTQWSTEKVTHNRGVFQGCIQAQNRNEYHWSSSHMILSSQSRVEKCAVYHQKHLCQYHK